MVWEPGRGSIVRRGKGLLLALLVPVVLTGCTAGPSRRPAVVENDARSAPTAGVPSTVPLPPLTEPRSPSVQWSDCDTQVRSRLEPPSVPASALSFTCATVTSVLDSPDLPGRIPTHVALLKAGSGPIPLLVLNDIEGESGTHYAAHLAAALPPALLSRFSLIGVDRRGTGDSDAVGCVPRDVRTTLLSQDPAADEIDEVLDAARRAGQQCAIDLGNSQLAIDSWRAAGDLEQIRVQLGVPKLNAIAHGEASHVLTSYAARYPGRFGRVVLDGIPDPSPDPATALADLTAARQSTLDAFGRDCADRRCGLGDATAAVTTLLDRLRADQPMLGDGTAFSPGLALDAITVGLANPARWPELATAIQAAGGGNPAPLAAFVDPMLHGSQAAPPRLDGALATECNDSSARLSANQITALGTRLRQQSALFGAAATERLTWCLPWPGRTTPLPPPGVAGLPPILVTATASDPVTPEPGTTRAAAQMPSAVRISWQGSGHAAFTSPCVGEAVRAFLADGKVPADGTLCPA
ncbi:alpha/beta hydrolase [Amycolatopsis pigmentata]|uniref:Alpha/beta hydrolase n=1 Tax=Amycolatopsis pigmentata TaxID=450801 RepID=A0ABW5FXH2_9PSEU